MPGGQFQTSQRFTLFFGMKNGHPPEVPLCRMVCQVCCVIFARSLPLAQCSWSSASHSVERKWRTAKGPRTTRPDFIEIFVQTITVGTVGWQAIAAKCRDGQKSSASGMIILKFNEVLGCKCSMF